MPLSFLRIKKKLNFRNKVVGENFFVGHYFGKIIKYSLWFCVCENFNKTLTLIKKYISGNNMLLPLKYTVATVRNLLSN